MKSKMNRKYICLLAAAMLMCGQCLAQKECMEEVLAIFKKTDKDNDSLYKGKTMLFSYTVKVTNWEDELVVSNVKTVYRDGLLNMQSEQAQIYQSDNEVLMILPTQQIAILNETTKQLNTLKMTEEFYEARYDFLKNCDVERCETNGDIRTVYAKPKKEEVESELKIVKMSCAYNHKTKKIVSVTMNYSNDYKLKEMTTVYHELKPVDDFKFAPPHTYYFNSKGKPYDKYKSYAFQDNRKNEKK